MDAVDLGRLSRTLTQDPSGIWRAADDPAVVSFPETFYGACFELEDRSFWFEHRNDCIVAALRRHRFTGPLLDVGGGNGAVSAALERSGIATVLLEPGVEGARNARRRGLRDVVRATLDEAAFDPGSFGAAGLFDVIEHVPDDVQLLRSVRTVLRPGGVLCVTVPAHALLWSAADEQAGHFRRYTLAELRSALAGAGFDVRYATYLFAPLVVPIFLLRSLRHRVFRRSAGAITASAARDHTPSVLARRALGPLLRAEARRIRRGRTVRIGTSCLAVAVAS